MVGAEELLDALVHADHAEHAHEALAVDEALAHEEGGLEEVGILNQELDARVHVLQQRAGRAGEQLVE